MIFNSLEFVIFFAVVLGTFFFVPHRLRWAFLLAASFYFYGSYNPLILAQLLLSIGATYWLSLRIEAETDAELVLVDAR